MHDLVIQIKKERAAGVEWSAAGTQRGGSLPPGFGLAVSASGQV